MPNTTVPAAGEAMPKSLIRRLLEVDDVLSLVRYLGEAVWMAAADLQDSDKTNAIQSVLDMQAEKLLIVRDQLDEIRGELA